MIAKAIEAVQSVMIIARKDIFVLISSNAVFIRLGSVIPVNVWPQFVHNQLLMAYPSALYKHHTHLTALTIAKSNTKPTIKPPSNLANITDMLYHVSCKFIS